MANEELSEAEIQELLDSVPEQPRGVVLKGDDGTRYFLAEETAAAAALKNSAEFELFESILRYWEAGAAGKVLDAVCLRVIRALIILALLGQTNTQAYQNLLSYFKRNCLKLLLPQGPASPE